MVTGVSGSSGLDVNSIVSQLMTLERRPLDALNQREAQINSRLAAYSRVQGAVGAVQMAAATLARMSTFTGLRANVVGDGASAAVTDTSKAAAGSYALKVTQLAASQALASQAMTTGAVVGTGTVTIELGSVTGGVFTPKSGSVATPIAVTSSNSSLAGIRDAINAAKVGVTAAVVNDNSGARLTVTANDTGVANTIRISVVDDDSTNGDDAGLSRLAFDPTIALPVGSTTGPGRQLVQSRAAADAAFEINGLALTASSNKVTGAIDGISLDLRKADAAAVTSITVSADIDAARGAIDTFVRSYNDLDKVIRELTSYDPVKRTGAVLNGEAAIRSLQNQVRGLVRGQISAATGDFTSLSDAGLEFGRDGTLSLNGARLSTALGDLSKLGRLFAATSGTESAQGLGVRIEALTKSAIGANGLLEGRTKGLQSQIADLDRQQDRLIVRLDMIEARLRQQYSSLDATLQRMQSETSSLSNLFKTSGSSGG